MRYFANRMGDSEIVAVKMLKGMYLTLLLDLKVTICLRRNKDWLSSKILLQYFHFIFYFKDSIVVFVPTVTLNVYSYLKVLI